MQRSRIVHCGHVATPVNMYASDGAWYGFVWYTVRKKGCGCVMDWVERMNLALDILEQNPSDPPDATAISRCMACPYAVFLRMFMPLTGVTLSEYVRRRRLSRAAADLQCSDLRVLDVALRYGYDSADAFTAAFKRMHGLTPQEARNPGAKLAFYPRMTFTMTLQGVQPMRYR